MTMTEASSTVPQSVLRLLPPSIAQLIGSLSPTAKSHLTEIRLRVGKPLELVGVPSREKEYPLVVAEHVRHILSTVTGSSLHTVEQEVKGGYVTAPGGHRVGLAGRIILGEDGRVKMLRDIASINIRVAVPALDSARCLAPYLQNEAGKLLSALLVGPPLSGKTTLLRDLARLLGSGLLYPGSSRIRVTVVDERSEIAGCVQGIPQFDVGLSTDVLDGCPKIDGMHMALRSLSPQVIVTDELGSKADADAVMDVARAGVIIIGSLHGASIADIQARPAMSQLLSSGAIDRIVVLDRSKGPGQIGRVTDAQGRGMTRLWA